MAVEKNTPISDIYAKNFYEFSTVEEALQFFDSVIVHLGVDFAVLDGARNIMFISRDALPPNKVREEVTGEFFYDVFPHVKKEGFPQKVDRVFASGKPIINLYTRYTNSRGKEGYYNQKFLPVMIDGECKACIVMIEDVSEYRATELHAHESEFRYQRLIETMNLVSFRLDATGKFTFVNNACLDVFEWSPAEMLGTSFVQYVHDEDVGNLWRTFWEVVNQNEKHGTVENRIITRTGKMKHMRWNIHPLYDTDGKVIGSQGVGEDVTQKEEMVQELQDGYGKYRGFFNALPVPVCIIDQANFIVGANRRMCKKLSYSQKEMRSLSIFDILPAREAELQRISKIIERLKTKGGISREQIMLQRKDKSTVRFLVNGVRYGPYFMLIFDKPQQYD